MSKLTRNNFEVLHHNVSFVKRPPFTTPDKWQREDRLFPHLQSGVQRCCAGAKNEAIRN